MFHLKEIKNKFRITAAMWNRVVAFLNNLCGSAYINISRPDDPSPGSPVVVSLDIERVRTDVNSVTQPPSTKTITSGFQQSTNFSKLTDGGFRFGAAGGQGVKCKMAFRGVDNGEEGSIFWREVTIASDGRIYMIGNETDAMGVYTAQ